jgi:hypothetical protein
LSDSDTQLQDAIRDLLRGLRNPDLPPRAAVGEAAERILLGLAGASRRRAGKDYDQIARELRRLCTEGIELDWRQVRDGTWCLWTTSPSLSDEQACIAAVLKGVSGSDQRQPYRALASSWLTSFDPGRSSIQEAAAILKAKASVMGPPWDALHAIYDLFDVDSGPRNIAAAAVLERVSPTVLLARSGLGAFDSSTGYVRSCLRAYLEKLAGSSEPQPLARLALVRSLVLKPDGKLLFEELGPLVVRALLAPFGTSTPAKSVRDAYLGFLLDLFRDPRLHPDRWTRMRDVEPIVRKWLTEQSLRQFLDLADQAAASADPDLKHMWPARRKFWEAVYNAELISEAWVVFGPEGARLARRSFGDGASFGRFDRSGRKPVDSGHTVLLLRIGRGVVADWSFNGKCNIWPDAEDREPPKLYRSTYSSDDVLMPNNVSSDVRAGLFSTLHSSSWQRRVAEKLHRMTGVRIPGYL